MTAGIRQTIETVSGVAVGVCPWRAFRDPFVARVLAAFRFFESGQLAFALPEPSHRLVEGLAFYSQVDNRVHGHMLDKDREDRKRESERQRLMAEIGRGR